MNDVRRRRLAATVRAGWGLWLVARPGPATHLLGCSDDWEGRWVARALGARDLLQAGAVLAWPTARVTAVGAAVDLIHAASMGLVAAVSSSWRTPAVRSGSVALGLGGVGLADARQAQPGS